MTAFFIANLAPIMFGVLVLFLLSGFPVAFALAANGLLFAWIGMELGLLQPQFLQALPNRLLGIMQNDTLLAIPFFGLMGMILERSGMAEDLLDTIGQLFGRIRGGLAYAVIFVGALLAATTGIVAASVISMGLISLPIMLKYGYDKKLATGVIAASGTLAQIIPPSLVLIVLADQLGRSVGDFYKAAFIPGLLLTFLYVIYVLILTIVKPSCAPALPRDPTINLAASGRSLIVLLTASTLLAWLITDQWLSVASFDIFLIAIISISVLLSYAFALLNHYLKLHFLSPFAEKVIFVLVPPLGLIFLVLGTLFLGVATPSEAGAMGAIGALLLAIIKRRLTFDLLRQAIQSTGKLSCFVMFILIGSTVFSLVFRGVSGDLWVEHLLTSLPGGKVGFLIAVNLLFFVLAFFLDFFELAFILVPLVGPVAEKLGIDLVWFGILLGINMQTSFMHPPFGFALFYLRSVAPKTIKTTDIYWGAIPFVAIQLIMVALVIIYPGIISVEKHEKSTDDIELLIPATNHIAPNQESTPYEFQFDTGK